MEEILTHVVAASSHVGDAAREVSELQALASRQPGASGRLTDVETELLALAAAGLDEANAALQTLRQAIGERRDRSNGR